MSTLHLPPGITYDAAPILGLGAASDEPLPDPGPGEVIVRVGAWSLQDLRTLRHNLMGDHDWCKEHPFFHEKLTPGIYRARLPIPDSNWRKFNELKQLLHDGEEVAPAALVATALFCLKQTGQDLLGTEWARCVEVLPDELRVILNVHWGRVRGSHLLG
ncbi:MAG: hypothetical protein QM775_31020 [Pirellulales bacterium]